MSEELRETAGIVAARERACHEIGDLFCWCVESLTGFPPRHGNWIDDVKRRLVQQHPPDDDTPIDEAWLLAVGGQQGRFLSDILFGPLGRGVNREVGKPYWFIRSWPIPDEAAPTTRGQLRRLVTALGIELKEGTA